LTAVLATSNPEKVAELVPLLAAHGIAATWTPLPSPEEDGATYEANAVIKARAAALALGVVALGDDAGLEVESLGGAPGLWTRRWADELGGWAPARAALAKLAGGRARFHCGLALAWPDGRVVSALGSTEGHLVPATVDGVGLEPCFVADGTTAPLPALSAADRERVHYRARALRALLAACAATDRGVHVL
jgi:XTP/dITP diphosphohydrolase